MTSAVDGKTPAHGRRGFLKRVAIAGGSVGAVAAAGGVVAGSGAPDAPDVRPRAEQDEPTGYRETPHIREYYRLADD